MVQEGDCLKDTKCWHCKNAVPGKNCGCSWSEHFQPVEGWTAKSEQFAGMHGLTYRVLECPEFVPDDPKIWWSDSKASLDEPYLRLAEGILKRTFDSYRQALRSWERRHDESAAYELYRLERTILTSFFESLTLYHLDLLKIVNGMRKQVGLEPRSGEWRKWHED